MCCSYMLRVHGCVRCYVNLLFVFLCMCMPSRAQSPLRECPRARRFQATLLLRTIRMRSQRLGGLAVWRLTLKQTNIQFSSVLSGFTIATRQKVVGVDCDRANLDYTDKYASNNEIIVCPVQALPKTRQARRSGELASISQTIITVPAHPSLSIVSHRQDPRASAAHLALHACHDEGPRKGKSLGD